MMSNGMIWNMMEACRSFYPSMESDGMQWKGTEEGGRIGDVGHVWSQLWHYPPVNVSSLVQRFWCLHNREYGGSWDGHRLPDRPIQLCTGDGGFCNRFHYAPMSGIGGTALCSGSRGCRVLFCSTIHTGQVLVWTPDTRGLWWHWHLLEEYVGGGARPSVDLWSCVGVGKCRHWWRQGGLCCHAWSSECCWTHLLGHLVAWLGFATCSMHFGTTALLLLAWGRLWGGWPGWPGA